MQKIVPCLWFDNQAEEAVHFYAKIFKNSKIGRITRYNASMAKASGQPMGSVMTVSFELEGFKAEALNGGPAFKFTPALSFYVNCESEAEIDEKWKHLSAGGQARMALDKYPWSEKYGWTTDKYGMEWQLIVAPGRKKIVPAFLFVDQLFGQGEKALQFYMSVFKNSKIENIVHDEENKRVLHCAFTLEGQNFVLMEGRGQHGYTFSHALSLMVNCETQAEIDTYWEQLSDRGTEEPCGWLKDPFGVSWQIVPTALYELMDEGDPARIERSMQAMLKMKKLNLSQLLNP
jgi:predicted 3-demethylubiquinone-9 3-methyltransferase (glyoxalase superfamily)